MGSCDRIRIAELHRISLQHDGSLKENQHRTTYLCSYLRSDHVITNPSNPSATNTSSYINSLKYSLFYRLLPWLLSPFHTPPANTPVYVILLFFYQISLCGTNPSTGLAAHPLAYQSTYPETDHFQSHLETHHDPHISTHEVPYQISDYESAYVCSYRSTDSTTVW